MRSTLLHDLVHMLLDPKTIAGAVIYGVVLLTLAWLASRLMRVWTQRLSAHPRLFIDKTSAMFVAQVLRITCFLVAAGIYSHLVPPLRQLATALLASAGVISLVVGLAAQNTLGQMIAGFAILFYRPFEIDDVLTVITASGKEETGTVRRFTLGYTRLHAQDGRWIIVPNSVMLASIVINAPVAEREAARDPPAAPLRSGASS